MVEKKTLAVRRKALSKAAQGKRAGVRPRSVKPPPKRDDPVARDMAEKVDQLLFELTQEVLTSLIELTKRAKEKFSSKDELDTFATPFGLLADRAFTLLAASDYMVEVQTGD